MGFSRSLRVFILLFKRFGLIVGFFRPSFAFLATSVYGVSQLCWDLNVYLQGSAWSVRAVVVNSYWPSADFIFSKLTSLFHVAGLPEGCIWVSACSGVSCFSSIVEVHLSFCTFGLSGWVSLCLFVSDAGCLCLLSASNLSLSASFPTDVRYSYSTDTSTRSLTSRSSQTLAFVSSGGADAAR